MDFSKIIFWPVFLVSIICLLFVPSISNSLTLEEALSLAKQNLPSYKASELQIKSSEAIFHSSFSPYLPSIDASTTHQRIFTSQEELTSRTYDLTLAYTLFDGGYRKAKRNIARLNLDISTEDFKKNLLDLEYNVKVAFYNAIAKKEIEEQRKIQLKDAEKDYEVAEGRYKFGVAKLSDTLQASVRLEQARFNLVQAEGEYKKALSDLNSLIGNPLDTEEVLQGSLDIKDEYPDIDKLFFITLQRPEIKQAEDLLKISEQNKLVSRSSFFPSIYLNASYIKTGGDLSRTSFSEEKTAGLTARWNIFDLGKFYTLRSSEFDRRITVENLNDLKRQLLLNINNTYQDYITASKNLLVAKEQLKQAEHNYSQALGEYKVGKADILSLILAESLLSNSREQLVNAKLSLILSKTLLERTAGIHSLESLQD
ncbi:MAG: TolC family protein [Nitrospirae bacterium]|nr:TolC family protein [Nitrospirota bacterium]